MNAVYEQKDPLLIYKFEAFEMFKGFIGKLNEDVTSFLTRADLPKQDPAQVNAAAPRRRQEPEGQASKAEVSSTLNPGANRAAAAAASAGRAEAQVVAPRKVEKSYGRNGVEDQPISKESKRMNTKDWKGDYREPKMK